MTGSQDDEGPRTGGPRYPGTSDPNREPITCLCGQVSHFAFFCWFSCFTFDMLIIESEVIVKDNNETMVKSERANQLLHWVVVENESIIESESRISQSLVSPLFYFLLCTVRLGIQILPHLVIDNNTYPSRFNSRSQILARLRWVLCTAQSLKMTKSDIRYSDIQIFQ